MSSTPSQSSHTTWASLPSLVLKDAVPTREAEALNTSCLDALALEARAQPLPRASMVIKRVTKVVVSRNGLFVALQHASATTCKDTAIRFTTYAWHCGRLVPVWYFDLPPHTEDDTLKEITLANDGLALAWYTSPATLPIIRRGGITLLSVDRRWLGDWVSRLSKGFAVPSSAEYRTGPVCLRTVLRSRPWQGNWEQSSNYSFSLSLCFSICGRFLYMVPNSNQGCEHMPLSAFCTGVQSHASTESNVSCTSTSPPAIPNSTTPHPLETVAFLNKHPDSEMYIHGAIIEPDWVVPERFLVQVIHHQSGTLARYWEITSKRQAEQRCPLLLPSARLDDNVSGKDTATDRASPIAGDSAGDGNGGTDGDDAGVRTGTGTCTGTGLCRDFMPVSNPGRILLHEITALCPRACEQDCRLAVGVEFCSSSIVSTRTPISSPDASQHTSTVHLMCSKENQMSKYVLHDPEEKHVAVEWEFQNTFPITTHVALVTYSGRSVFVRLDREGFVDAVKGLLHKGSRGFRNVIIGASVQLPADCPSRGCRCRAPGASTTPSSVTSTSASALLFLQHAIPALGCFFTASGLAKLTTVCVSWRNIVLGSSAQAHWQRSCTDNWGLGTALILRALSPSAAPSSFSSTSLTSSSSSSSAAAAASSARSSSSPASASSAPLMSFAQFYQSRVRHAGMFATLYAKRIPDVAGLPGPGRLAVHPVPIS